MKYRVELHGDDITGVVELVSGILVHVYEGSEVKYLTIEAEDKTAACKQAHADTPNRWIVYDAEEETP